MYTFSRSIMPAESFVNESKVSNAHFVGLMWKPDCFWCTMEIGQTCCIPEQVLIPCLNYCAIDLHAISAIELYYCAVEWNEKYTLNKTNFT